MASNTGQFPQISKPNNASSIVISNTNSTNLHERDLREQIIQEIENKSKWCSNPTYECSIPRLDGFDYCIRHILRDPRGAYRQCTFIFPNGRKCTNAVQKFDIKKDPATTTLCFEHSRQTQLLKTHALVGKLRRVETNEVMLNNLSHHLNTESVEPTKVRECEQDEEIDVVSPAVEPFVSYEQIHDIETVTAKIRKKRRILDYASDSSEELEPGKTTLVTRALELNESENECDSPDEDYLKRAGIYTRQEAIRISEAKLTRLQGLYIDQINHLHHMLKDRRRRYLHEVRKERETYCSIHDQIKDSPKERSLYEQFKALNKYHRRHGEEAVLYKKYKEKRSRTGHSTTHKSSSSSTSGTNRCIYTEGGVKCGERPLPCTKYCRKHILEDKKQTLFRACNVERGGVVCREPVICIGDEESCILHFDMPPLRQFTLKKYESETDDDEKDIKEELEDEVSADTTIANNVDIKVESDIIPETEGNDSAKGNMKDDESDLEFLGIDVASTAPVTNEADVEDEFKTELKTEENMDTNNVENEKIIS